MSQSAYKWMPKIDTDACSGCGLCVKACTPQALELVWDFATLTRTENCNSCHACLDACPNEVIRMGWVNTAGDQSKGVWRERPPEERPAPAKHWLWGLIEKRTG